MYCSTTEQWEKYIMEAFGGIIPQRHTPALGIRMVPKLKLEHISLTSFSKMRVDLAAQVS